MNSLIYDVDEIKDFVTRVLAPLEDDEVYILLLNTRKKYCKEELSRSEEILGRELIRDNDVQKTLRKINKIARTDGIYVDRNTLRPVPIHCMAVYCLTDPRSTLKGYGEFIEDINRWIYESFKGESKNLELYRRIDIKLFSAIHKNRSRRLFSIIDIDKKDETILDDVTDLLKGHIKWVSETHGGFHVIANRVYDAGVIIYTEIVDMEDVEVLKEPMTPLPGTLQGGFQVKGIRRELWN
jgi:hypothetical protein